MQRPEIVTPDNGSVIDTAKRADAMYFAEASAIVTYHLGEFTTKLSVEMP